MKDEKKKSNKKALVLGSLAALLIVIAVAVTYKIVFVKPEGEMSGTAYADNRDDIKPIEVATPTPMEDKPVYVMDVDEILNSEPVVTTVTPVPDEEVNRDAEAQEDVADSLDKAADQDVGEDKDSEPAKKEEKKEKKVVVDESPKTIKEKNVKEYEGGENTGSGNSFMDQIPKQDPIDNDEYGGVPASGEAVGTWN